MTRDLQRLSVEELTARLNQAGKEELPSDQAMNNTLRALKLPAAATAGAAATAWWAWYARVGGIAGAMGIVLAAGVWLFWPGRNASTQAVSPAPADSNAVALVPSTTEAPAITSLVKPSEPEALAMSSQPTPSIKLSAPAQQSAAAPAASGSNRQPEAADRLLAEVRALDEVRGAIRANAPTRALSLLDRYNSEFPKPVLASEAQVLRIQALSLAGNTAAARQQAEAFLRASPNGPLSNRVRSLVGLLPSQ